MTFDYSAPVDQLLTLGNKHSSPVEPEKWLDYVKMFNFTSEDIPQLTKMTTDASFNLLDSDQPGVYAPLHAWRTLGQLKAVSAIPDLINMLNADDDYIAEELPLVLGMLGAEAIVPLKEYILANRNETYPAALASDALEQVGRHYPEARQDVIDTLVSLLELYETSDPGLNTSLVSNLAELKATETLPFIETVVESEYFDDDFDNWNSIRHTMGVITTEEYKQLEPSTFPAPERFPAKTGNARKAKPKSLVKSKRKIAKESRRKNRKK